MKKLNRILIMAMTLGYSLTSSAQSVTHEVKSDTIPVTKVFVEDSATGVLKSWKTPFIIRKIKITTVKVEGAEVPQFSQVMGLYDDKLRKLAPIIIIDQQGKAILIQ